jgi:enterochelin esterase-like enzyme
MQRPALVRFASVLFACIAAPLVASWVVPAHAVDMRGAGAGSVLENQEFKSAILQRDVRYSIYLPPGYTSNTTRRYPVVYLLHGFPAAPVDSESDWVQSGAADRLADEGIATGRLPPMILVMPDAKATWYVNSADGKVRYEDMFVQELIPFIDRTYRTHAQRVYRGIAGLSMGGFGALTLAMRHPDLFSACAALSPGLHTEDETKSMEDAAYARYFAPAFGAAAKGDARLTENWRKYSPLALARTLPAEQLRKTLWWIDIGDDDYLSQGSDAMHTVLKQRQIPHEYRVRDGAHEWIYWRTGLTDALAFVAESYW